MIAKLFRPKEYLRPTTVGEAVSLLAKYGEKARPFAGSTDLLVTKPPEVEYIVDITHLPLDYIEIDEEGVKIGALTKFRELETSTLLNKAPYNILAEAAHLSGHVAQRNMATIGGNICQNNRCWYYWVPDNRFYCMRKGGRECYALTGDGRYHSVFGQRG